MQLLHQETKGAVQNKDEGSDIDRCVDAVLDVAPPVVRAIRSMMREHRLPELSVPQFRTLALLHYNGKACLSNVADFIGSSLPAASRMMDGLVAKNLVARAGCPDDRRQISLELTPLGRKLFVESRQATRHQLAVHLAGLSPEQKQGIVAAMACLGEIFGTDANLPAQTNDSTNGSSKTDNRHPEKSHLESNS